MEKDKKAKLTEEKNSEMEYPIIGKSRAVDQLLKQISRLSKVRKDIVIIGEAGIGRGAVAENLYSMSCLPEDNTPFMSINLSVLDDKELEAVLFGYDRGIEGLPYTTKRGLFEIANGGTVLIEEIEEASFRNQMKILAFMNERTARRIGGSRAEPVDIRLIVTVKEDPRSLVDKRKLLEDLFNKLSDFERIEIPPLRERPEDIPLLVKHFAGELCKEIGIGELVIDINAIDVLVRQSWRENIRELKAVVDKSVLFSNGTDL